MPNDHDFCSSCGTPARTELFYIIKDDLNINIVAKKEIEIVQNIFSESYKIRDYLISLHRGNTDKNDMNKITIIGHLNDKTIELLDGVFMLLRLNLINVSQTLVRPIIDNIITQYYLDLIETDLANYEKKLLYQTPPKNKTKPDEETRKILINYKIDNMIDSLYSNDNKAKINEMMDWYNSFIHPDPRPNYNRILTVDSLKLLIHQSLSLSFLNLHARIQSYQNTEYEHKIFLDTNGPFIELLQRNSVVLGRYVPNHRNIVNKLVFGDLLKIQK